MIVAMLVAASIIHGDFDRDGRSDSARVVRTKHGSAITVTRANGQRETVYNGTIGDLYLAINTDRGWIRTACGKGYDVSCSNRSPNRIRLHGGELLFGERESSDFVLLYRAGHFQVVQLTD